MSSFQDCPICLEEMKVRSKTCTTACNHTFHTTCFRKLKITKCPSCRADVIPDIHHQKRIVKLAIHDKREEIKEVKQLSMNIATQYVRIRDNIRKEFIELNAICLRYNTLLLKRQKEIIESRIRILEVEKMGDEHEKLNSEIELNNSAVEKIRCDEFQKRILELKVKNSQEEKDIRNERKTHNLEMKVKISENKKWMRNERDKFIIDLSYERGYLNYLEECLHIECSELHRIQSDPVFEARRLLYKENKKRRNDDSDRIDNIWKTHLRNQDNLAELSNCTMKKEFVANFIKERKEAWKNELKNVHSFHKISVNEKSKLKQEYMNSWVQVL